MSLDSIYDTFDSCRTTAIKLVEDLIRFLPEPETEQYHVLKDDEVLASADATSPSSGEQTSKGGVDEDGDTAVDSEEASPDADAPTDDAAPEEEPPVMYAGNNTIWSKRPVLQTAQVNCWKCVSLRITVRRTCDPCVC
jgi:hypothetical protein